MSKFRTYMIQRGYARSTIESYQKVIKLFYDWLEEEVINIQTLVYNDLLEYINHLQAKELTTKSINFHLIAIEHYLNSKNIKIESLRSLRIRNTTKRIMIANVVPYDQLEYLYDQYPTGTIYQKRNKTIIGLMIYQALTTKDLSRLTIHDIHIHNGSVEIKASKSSSKRLLQLHRKQILPLHEYLGQTRKDLLAEHQMNPTNKLFFTPAKDLHNVFTNLLKQVNDMDVGVESFHQIRASVIHQWLQEHNLREVQYMAGHKYVSSIEQYIDRKLVELENDLSSFHPLG